MSQILAFILSLFLMTCPAQADAQLSEFGDMASSFVSAAQPISENDFVTMMQMAALTGSPELSFSYSASVVSKSELESVIKQAYETYKHALPEYSMYVSMTKMGFKQEAGNIKVTLYFNNRDGVGPAELQSAMTAARRVYDELYKSGTLKASMTETETERARAILQYICANMQYQDSSDMLAKTAYCGFTNGYGVCGAYTGMYDTLLKLDGITCYGRYGSYNGIAHEWTVALLDGRLVNIDATFCDVGDKMSNKFFAKSDVEMAKTHTWQ